MLLKTYLEKHGLYEQVAKRIIGVDDDIRGWTVRINHRAKTRFGLCSYSKRVVELTSEYYENGVVKEGEETDHNNTLLHETAHVIVRHRNVRRVSPHGEEWKEVMRMIGGGTHRCGKSKVLAAVRKTKPHKHLYTCKDCGVHIPRQRELKDYTNRYHPKCKRKPNGGKLDYQRVG